MSLSSPTLLRLLTTETDDCIKLLLNFLSSYCIITECGTTLGRTTTGTFIYFREALRLECKGLLQVDCLPLVSFVLFKGLYGELSLESESIIVCTIGTTNEILNYSWHKMSEKEAEDIFEEVSETAKYLRLRVPPRFLIIDGKITIPRPKWSIRS
jgi:hypothetical protein